jgi:hypothetical protein
VHFDPECAIGLIVSAGGEKIEEYVLPKKEEKRTNLWNVAYFFAI